MAGGIFNLRHNKTRRLILKTAVTYLSALILFIAWAETSWAEEVVRIGGSPYPISTFKENGRVVGLDFDIVELALKEAGITRVVRVLKPWKRIMNDLDKGRVDLVVPMVYTREREEKYLLAPSIRTRFNIVLVQKGFKGQIAGIPDLAGLTVGKCDGYAYQDEFNRAAAMGVFTPGYCVDNEMGLRKLQMSRFDAFMIGEDAALYLIKQMGFKGAFRYAGYKAPKASHVGFHKSRKSLYNAYVTGFASIREKGLVDAAVQTWHTLYAID